MFRFQTSGKEIMNYSDLDLEEEGQSSGVRSLSRRKQATAIVMMGVVGSRFADDLVKERTTAASASDGAKSYSLSMHTSESFAIPN